MKQRATLDPGDPLKNWLIYVLEICPGKRRTPLGAHGARRGALGSIFDAVCYLKELTGVRAT